MHQFPFTLNPLYYTSSVNESVELFRGDMQLTQSGKAPSIASGTIELIWVPQPSLVFNIPSINATYDLSDAELTVPKFGSSHRVFVNGRNPNNEGGIHHRGMFKEAIVVGRTSRCERILFHLPNFIKFMGQCIRDMNGYSWAGRLTLEYANWRVILDGIPKTEELTTALKNECGFAITHVGALEKTDGNLVDYENACETLQGLFYFLSFARGLWCGPILFVGQSNNEVIWQKWHLPHLMSWQHVESWLPYFHMAEEAEHLKDAFHGFMEKWCDTSLWQSVLKMAIHWYIDSNRDASTAEISIVSTQSALEMLSWVYSVEDPLTQKCTARKFKDANAEEQIRRLFSALQIPTAVPIDLNYLSDAMKNLSTTDGLATFVKLRNKIVHPQKTNRKCMLQTSAKAKVEAAQLGLWYLEMVLLKLVGYSGTYYQRFRNGSVNEIRVSMP